MSSRSRISGRFALRWCQALGLYKPWVKCVEVDYLASEHVGGNPRAGPQRYFGWMKMECGCSVPQLWSGLMCNWLSGIAPPTIGGRCLEIWESLAEL
ncbi:hypothetical protein K504DRAFT_463126 [Pleomassaria siparia CBS 279.74]|uniref:Uncharacterized protein n=1 Tax=Pleomassaria siparia CBS 279.74 TaxID=1314801 RepID=A0A6G1JU73_9PLEO|nr:hypothetical protein K504DRAFT_463126 [Pleomassaria siparia CBS 279.74]